MEKPNENVTALALILLALVVVGSFILPPSVPSIEEQGCIDSGGIVETGMCCMSVGDFPNTCVIGACGCAPEHSHDVKVCDCGLGRCFDGEKCVTVCEAIGGRCVDFQESCPIGYEVSAYGCSTKSEKCCSPMSEVYCFTDKECESNEFCEFTGCLKGKGMCVEVPMICPFLMDPVCGCDGQTYPNDCARKMSKVSKAYDGSCLHLP